MRNSSLRMLSLALVIAGLSVSSAAVASASADAGTLVGTVTCGADEALPAAHVVVAAEGINLQTLTDGSGHFRLADVPAHEPFTIDVVADPERSVVTSRFNVVVEAGQTLDIGSMDLAVCGQPTMPVQIDQSPADSTTDNQA